MVCICFVSATLVTFLETKTVNAHIHTFFFFDKLEELCYF